MPAHELTDPRVERFEVITDGVRLTVFDPVMDVYFEVTLSTADLEKITLAALGYPD